VRADLERTYNQLPTEAQAERIRVQTLSLMPDNAGTRFRSWVLGSVPPEHSPAGLR
jgi:hypothetical protein